jgi:hypothetical protein
MDGHVMFKRSDLYPLSDWLVSLREYKTPWGKLLCTKNEKLQIREEGSSDSLLRTNGGDWHYSGKEPVEVSPGIYQLKATTVLWLLNGPFILFCTEKEVHELRQDQQACKIALAVCG